MRVAIAVGVLLSPGVGSACPGPRVLIEELLPDPQAANAGQEWVELLAPEADADVSGFVIARATKPGSFAPVFTLPSGSVLPAGVPVVVAPPGAPLPDVAVWWVPAQAELGNAGSSSDAVRLEDGLGCVVDVVVYGATNAPGEAFEDEHGDAVLQDRLAPRPAAGRALARSPSGVDLDHGGDFVLGTPTPGEVAGVGAPADCAAGVPGEVVINELLVDPEGADAGQEWLELFNASAEAASLAGWRIEQAGAPGDWGERVRVVLPEDVVLAPGAWLLLAEDGVVTPGASVSTMPGAGRLGLGNAQDAVRLVDCAGAVIDQVVYGARNPDGFEAASGEVLTDADVGPAAREAWSIARRADGLDTDRDADDLHLAERPTPGAANPDLRCRGLAGTVKINELLPDPEGADAVADASWVELVHVGGPPVDLTGWRLEGLTRPEGLGPSRSVLATLPPGTALAERGFLVVGGLFAAEAQVVVEGLDPGSGSGVDAVRLVDCTGAVADTVLYGGVNDDGLAEDDGRVPARGAPDPDEDQCVARKRDGADHDVSADDFKTTSRCTPGSTNEVLTPTPSSTLQAEGCTGEDPPRAAGARGAACDHAGGRGVLGLLWVLWLPWRRVSRRSGGRPPGSPRWPPT